MIIKRVLMLAPAAVLLTAGAASADQLEVDGILYETVNWSSVDLDDGEALGTADGMEIEYEAVEFIDSLINLSNYGSDVDFDAPSYDTGMFESLNVYAGAEGMSRLQFDDEVGSILMFMGAPGSVNQDGHNSSIWNFFQGEGFDGGPSLSWIDGNIGIGPGNIIAGTGDGIIRIDGVGNSLEWFQSSTNGNDQMDFTIAIQVSTVPAPGAAALLLLAGGISRRRRRH